MLIEACEMAPLHSPEIQTMFWILKQHNTSPTYLNCSQSWLSVEYTLPIEWIYLFTYLILLFLMTWLHHQFCLFSLCGCPCFPSVKLFPVTCEYIKGEKQFYFRAQQFYEDVPASEEGMMGDFVEISNVDLEGSRQFLKKFVVSHETFAYSSVITSVYQFSWWQDSGCAVHEYKPDCTKRGPDVNARLGRDVTHATEQAELISPFCHNFFFTGN